MKSTANKLDEVSRRSFLAGTAKGLFGVSIGGSMASMFTGNAIADSLKSGDQVVNLPAGGKAKSVIYLFMGGGMSHIDTFDPKPEAGNAIMGETNTINGKGDMQLGHCLKNLSKVSDKISLVRSMTTTQGAHGPGKYYMRTGYTQRASITHPSAGGWVSKMKERENENIPSFVTVNAKNGHPGGGFFEPLYNPLPIADASEGLKNSKRHVRINEEKFEEQLDLRHELDTEFDQEFQSGYKNVRAYNDMYDEAIKLMQSKDLEVFDLSKEDKVMHKLYGADPFAKGCLLARRLVESNVNFIEVEYSGFDWHSDNFESMKIMVPVFDQAVSALLADLDQRGLLDTTLVVVATEFGRSPKINANVGRDHYPKAFSCMLAGGGVKGGYVHGKTDKTGSSVEEGKADAGNLNATIAHALGLEHDEILYSKSKRPFKMGGKDGKPIYDLFT